MGDLSTTIVEGSVIPAVLETAINSDAPGFVRGVVTRDVRGFDGSKVLVPRGSRLIGEYNSGTALGQSRAFVIWTRLIRPDGATVELSSPAADGLGQGGIGGRVDTKFLQRFGGAILLSLLNIGASAVSDSADTTVVIAGARAGADAASATLGAQGADIGPTITVMQGTPVRVFVSQDLSFAAVGPVAPSDSAN
jgi:type IV secretion system protein VirB10